MSSTGDSERGRGFFGGTKSLSLGSSSAVRDFVAAGLGLAGLDDGIVFLVLPEAVSFAGTGASGFVTCSGDRNFVCFLLGLWVSHLTSHFMLN